MGMLGPYLQTVRMGSRAYSLLPQLVKRGSLPKALFNRGILNISRQEAIQILAQAYEKEIASLGLGEKALFHAREFSEEVLAFLGWELLENHVNFLAQGKGLSEKNLKLISGLLSGEAMLDRVAFLAALKLGNRMARPVTEPLRQLATGEITKWPWRITQAQNLKKSQVRSFKGLSPISKDNLSYLLTGLGILLLPKLAHGSVKGTGEIGENFNVLNILQLTGLVFLGMGIGIKKNKSKPAGLNPKLKENFASIFRQWKLDQLADQESREFSLGPLITIRISRHEKRLLMFFFDKNLSSRFALATLESNMLGELKSITDQGRKLAKLSVEVALSSFNTLQDFPLVQSVKESLGWTKPIESPEKKGGSPKFSDEQISQALARHHGNRAKAARELGLQFKTISHRVLNSPEGSPLANFKNIKGKRRQPLKPKEGQKSEVPAKNNGSQTQVPMPRNRFSEGPIYSVGQLEPVDEVLIQTIEENNGNFKRVARSLERPLSWIKYRIQLAPAGSPLKAFEKKKRK